MRLNTVDLAHIVTRLFGPPEQVDDCEGHCAHLCRWTIFRKRALNVTVYHAKDVWSGKVQDCPRRFISVGVAKHEGGGAADFPDHVEWMVVIGKRRSNLEHRKVA